MTSAPVTAPFALVIDDDPKAPDQQLIRDLESTGIDATLVHPRDISEEDVERACVIAVDHYLREWPERESVPIGLRTRDGLAMCAVLRSHLQGIAETNRVAVRNVAYLVRTNDLDQLRGPLPPSASQYLMAAYHGLDWVQAKDPGGGPQGEAARIAGLAHAVSSLPKDWAHAVPAESEELASWLGLVDRSFRAAAAQQIEDSRPTAHRLAEQTGGSGFLRWFLQRVLPYPTFLVGEIRAALSLGVTPDAFQALLADEGTVGGQLRQAAYEGQLSTFFGPRWWRAGLQEVSWTLKESSTALVEALERVGVDPGQALLSSPSLVVVLGEDLEPKPTPVPLETAVRVLPDAWPSFAEDAWVELSDAQAAPELGSAVLVADRWRLTSE